MKLAYGFILISIVAYAQSPTQPGVGFPIVGIAPGQTVRLNVLNQAPAQAGASCNVAFQFYDSQGQVLKEKTVDLQPGMAALLDFNRDELPGGDPRVEVRAVLRFGYAGGAPPPPEVLLRFACNIVPSLEVFDNDTARTTLILTNERLLPPPLIPVP